jgi:branched-chain amino acid transport system substrate-binding protein
MKDGIELGREMLERRSTLPIEVFYRDDEGQAQEGIAAARDLIATHHVCALTGVVNSSVALALLPVIEEQKLTLVSGGASSPQLSGSSRFFFRTWPSDLEEARSMARYARGKRNWSKIAILYINNGYGVGLREPFRVAFENLGGKIVAEDSFLQGTTKFASQLDAIGRAKPEAVYLIGNPREMANCVKEAKESGRQWQFLSVSGFREPEVIWIAGAAAEGVILTDVSFDPKSKDADTKKFIEGFWAKYHREPQMLAATGYDALRVLVRALDDAQGDRRRVPEKLRALHNFPGATGPISFDEKGDVRKPVRLTEVRNRQFVPLGYLE